jgi:carotenoid cleavage dioxygenase
MNGYEDARGHVVLDVIRHPKMFATDVLGPNEGRSTLERWTIDPARTRVHEQRLDDQGQEFPRLDERLTGKSYRFGYTAGLGDDISLGGIKKHDVPRNPEAAEDDGWILAYVYDQSSDSSEVVILQANDFSAPPVATVHLPRRVPFGFHGNWVADSG